MVGVSGLALRMGRPLSWCASSKTLRGFRDRRTLTLVTRSSFLWVFPGAALALAACDIPSATFDGTTTGGGESVTATSSGSGGTTSTSDGGNTVTHPTTTTGGAGGVGGSVGGAATTTTTASSGGGGTGGMFPGPQVPCTDSGALCAPEKICCFHATDGAKDHCGDAGQCCPNVGSDPTCEFPYFYFECNGLEDCPGGKCCGGLTLGSLTSTFCGTTCTGTDEILMCKSNEGECGGGSSCQPVLDGYPGYSYCN